MKYILFMSVVALFFIFGCNIGKKKAEKKIAFYKSQPRDARLIGKWIPGSVDKRGGRFYPTPPQDDANIQDYKVTGEIESYIGGIDAQSGALTGGRKYDNDLSIYYFYTENDNKMYRLTVTSEKGGPWDANEYTIPYYEIKGDTLWTYESLPIETAIKHYRLRWTEPPKKDAAEE